ncbi:hypothetical protein HGA88_00430 [Candidatus Roizmanbacteria bacterium]|nr:hypothetical protein [Candidatus Roizmanbacteria bacterium]
MSTIASITELVQTVSEKNELFKQIERVSEFLYQSDSILNVIQKHVEFEFATQLVAYMHEHHITTPSGVEKVLQEIKNELKDRPVLQISLSPATPLHSLELMKTWITTNVKQPVLLDIQHNPSIIGGLVLAFEGRYRDYSYKLSSPSL